MLIAGIIGAAAIYLVAQYLDWRSAEKHRRDVEERIARLRE